MPTRDRRNSVGRRAGSRIPKILRFEPLEGRQLLSAGAAGTKAPDLVAVSFRADPNGDWGRPISISGTVRNQGNADAASPFKVDVYVSTAVDRSTGAVRIGSIEFDRLDAGTEEAFEGTLDLPPTAVPHVGEDGAVHIGLVVDAGNAVAESSELNNVDRGVGVDSSLVIIVPHVPASLAVKSVEFDDPAPAWGETVGVKVRIENTLGGQAPASTARVVLTPPNVAVGSGREVTLVGDIEVPELLPYQSVEVSGVVRLPDGPPKDFPEAGGFIARVIADADHDVNPVLAPQPPQGRGIDWQVLSIAPDPNASPADPAAPRADLGANDVLTPGATLIWGEHFQLAATITNQGEADSGPITVRFLLGGPNGELTNALVLGDARIEEGLAAGASQAITQTLKLPGKLPFNMPLGDGLGRILVQVDPDNTVDESDELNNFGTSAPMSLALPTPQAPDPPVLSPSPPVSEPSQPTPTPPPVNIPERQRRIQAYRERLQAFRQQMEQRRQDYLARRAARRFPQGPAGWPRNSN